MCINSRYSPCAQKGHMKTVSYVGCKWGRRMPESTPKGGNRCELRAVIKLAGREGGFR